MPQQGPWVSDSIFSFKLIMYSTRISREAGATRDYINKLLLSLSMTFIFHSSFMGCELHRDFWSYSFFLSNLCSCLWSAWEVASVLRAGVWEVCVGVFQLVNTSCVVQKSITVCTSCLAVFPCWSALLPVFPGRSIFYAEMGKTSKRVHNPQTGGLSFIEERLKELVSDNELQVNKGKENYLKMYISYTVEFQVTKQKRHKAYRQKDQVNLLPGAMESGIEKKWVV